MRRMNVIYYNLLLLNLYEYNCLCQIFAKSRHVRPLDLETMSSKFNEKKVTNSFKKGDKLIQIKSLILKIKLVQISTLILIQSQVLSSEQMPNQEKIREKAKKKKEKKKFINNIEKIYR